MNVLDVLDVVLPCDPSLSLDAGSIGEFFVRFLAESVVDPSMGWVDDGWLWHIYRALATELSPLGTPWIKGVFDSHGGLDDLPYEEMMKADGLLKEAVAARFGLSLS